MTSLLNQSDGSFEIVLVDDGSTDCSGTICDEYADGMHCRVIHQENAGPSRARNVGLREARSDYIAFVDADDSVNSRFVEMLTSSLEMKADMVISSNREPKNGVLSAELVDSQTALRELLYASSFTLCSWGCEVWGKLYRRDLALWLGFNESLWMAEDLDFNYRYIKKSSRIVLLDCLIYSHTECVFDSLTKTIGPRNKAPILVAKSIYREESCGPSDIILAAQTCVTAFSLYYFQLLSEAGRWNIFLLELEKSKRDIPLFDILRDPDVSKKLKCKFLLFKFSKRGFFLYYRMKRKYSLFRMVK